MRHTETTHYWTIDEHPNPPAVFDWIRGNWHDLGEPDVSEMADSLRALSDAIGCRIDYSISIVPDRGEYVRADTSSYDHTAFLSLYRQREDLPLTGMWCDHTILEAFNQGRGELESSVLRTLHAQGEWLYSDAGLRELCESNEYLFREDGGAL